MYGRTKSAEVGDVQDGNLVVATMWVASTLPNVQLVHGLRNTPHYIQPATTGSQSPQPPTAHYQQSTWNSPLVKNWKQLLPAHNSTSCLSRSFIKFQVWPGFFLQLVLFQKQSCPKSTWNSELWLKLGFVEWFLWMSNQQGFCYPMLITVLVKVYFCINMSIYRYIYNMCENFHIYIYVFIFCVHMSAIT